MALPDLYRGFRIFLTTLAALGFTATGAGAAITFDLKSPRTNSVVTNSVFVSAAVASTYELQSVTASIGPFTTNLIFSGTIWTNSIPLLGFTRGPQALTVTATDVFANSAQTKETFVYDPPLTLTIFEPREGTVARPSFPIDITSEAKDAVIGVYYKGELLATATNHLTGQATITGIDGQATSISITVSDAYGQSNSVSRSLYVLTATNWLERWRLDGPILDASSNALLFLDGALLGMRSLSNETITVITNDPNLKPSEGVFAGRTIIFGATASDGGLPSIYKFRDGVLTSLGVGESIFQKKGYAIWLSRPYTWDEINLYDAAKDSVTALTNPALTPSLAPNGDIVFVTMPRAYVTWTVSLYHAGIVTNLVSSSYSYSYARPFSDGTNVIYEKDPYPRTPEDLSYIAFYDGTAETILATNQSAAPITYAVNQGWAAFTRTGASGIPQLWTRSPQGTLSQATFFGVPSSLISLNSDGGIIFSSGGRLYRRSLGFPPEDINAWNFSFGDNAGRIFWAHSHWYWTLGRSFFELTSPITILTNSMIMGSYYATISTSPGGQLIVQASTNFTDWMSVATNSMIHSNMWQFIDTNTASSRFKFYRAISPL